MRLNRFLAAAGLGSRRSCEELIASRCVSINGRFIEKLATVVEEGDEVRVHGKVVSVARPVYLLLRKPKGYVVTRSDERGRPTVFDILPKSYAHLFHVGRLDRDSVGLLLLTNDGELTQKLSHPSHGVEKEYEVSLDKPYDSAHTEKLLGGIFIEGGRGRFEKLVVLGKNTVRVVLKQGIKRQIRLMFYDLGYEVTHLDRIRIAGITSHKLAEGQFRELTTAEVAALKKSSTRKPSASREVPDPASSRFRVRSSSRAAAKSSPRRSTSP